MSEAARSSVVHAFLDSVETNPYGFAARVIEKTREEFSLTYGQLHELAGEVAQGFADRGIGAGDRVIVALPAGRDFLATYLAALCTGVIPLIVPEPKPGRTAFYAANLQHFAKVMEARCILSGEALRDELGSALPIPAVTAERLRAGGRAALRPPEEAEAVAHLQATSGSTGMPKLGIVRHRNVTANVRAIGEAVRQDPDDILVTWLPFSHDMGLIGLSYALYWQIPIVISDTSNFVSNPLSWLQWMSRFAGTLSPAPNSAFQMCARLARLRPPKDLDLSPWRVALCGAEPVHESTLAQFQAAFGPFGLGENTLMPVYGLAEATLAVTISDLDRPFSADRVDADAIVSQGRAEPSTEPATSLPMVCVGSVVPGHEVRVVDGEGRLLPDRAVGEIEFSGPSVLDGYWRDDLATATLRRPDGWLRTGDLGYLVDGQLYVAGRHKDLLIVNGRNYTPNQIEAFVETVAESTLTPSVIAVGLQDPQLRTETLHLLLDTRLSAGSDERVVEERVRQALEEAFGLGGVGIHWIASGQIPRTNSGKVQRYLCRELVENELRRRDGAKRGMSGQRTA